MCIVVFHLSGIGDGCKFMTEENRCLFYLGRRRGLVGHPNFRGSVSRLYPSRFVRLQAHCSERSIRLTRVFAPFQLQNSKFLHHFAKFRSVIFCRNFHGNSPESNEIPDNCINCRKSESVFYKNVRNSELFCEMWMEKTGSWSVAWKKIPVFPSTE